MSFSEDGLRHARQEKMSMVFQKFALLPHKTVLKNAGMPLSVRGEDEATCDRDAAKWLDRVGLSGFENHYPAQLSGGMQQRVGLARALATDAEILLMDEAFSALDPLIRNDMQDVLLDLQEELHKTIVFITHDLDEALKIGDNIAILRDGLMVQEGSAQEIILNPADDYVTDFIQDINRTRVLEIGSVMTEKKSTKGPKLDYKTVIEEALPVLSAEHAEHAIVTKDDKAIGIATLDDMIQAIARPKKQKGDGKYK